MSLAQEDRAEGWQRDYGRLTGTVSELAAERHRTGPTAGRPCAASALLVETQPVR